MFNKLKRLVYESFFSGENAAETTGPDPSDSFKRFSFVNLLKNREYR